MDLINSNLDLKDIVNLRLILFKKYYNNELYINTLAELISSKMECLSIEYDNVTCSFIVKIKKTAMKKSNAAFTHCPEYYYYIMSTVFYEFIKYNENVIAHELLAYMDNPYDFLNDLYNSKAMYNICAITCINDNAVIVKL